MRIPYFKILNNGERHIYDVIMKDTKLITQYHRICNGEEEERGSGGVIFNPDENIPEGFDKA